MLPPPEPGQPPPPRLADAGDCGLNRSYTNQAMFVSAITIRHRPSTIIAAGDGANTSQHPAAIMTAASAPATRISGKRNEPIGIGASTSATLGSKAEKPRKRPQRRDVRRPAVPA